MADTAQKASKVLQGMFNIPQAEYDLMKFNAARYERTDAGIEDAILRQIYQRPDVKAVMAGDSGDVRRQDSVFAMKPVEFGRTKVLNTAGILRALGQDSSKNDRKNDELLISLYDENPNWVRNRVLYDKEYGATGAENVDAYIEGLRDKTYGKKMGKAEKIVKAIALPRVLEAEMAGVEPSGKDYALDLVENGLMALPLGNVAAAAKIAGRAQKAKRILGTLGAAAAVPAATEGLDALAYTSMENPDRSVFNQYDVLTHGATNLAAPFVAGRVMGRVGRMTGAGKAADEAKDVAKRNVTFFQDMAERKAEKDWKKYEGEFVKKTGFWPDPPLHGPDLSGAAKADAIIGGILDMAPSAGGSWLMNKYGSNRDADMFLGMIGRLAASTGEDPSTWVSEGRDEVAQDALDSARGDYARAMGSAVDEDDYWLKKIADNPSIVRGKGEGATAAFKNWWNTRGMSIFDGTTMFGGTME